ncbi:MAG TPA: PilX N-terminal domain-containing pilus assembly protein [Rhizomicrobium sp.]|jgi:general secretion pathway protein K
MLRERHDERGLALVSVLWGVAILSLIASAVLYASVLSVQLSRNSAASDQAAAVADAGISRAVLSLLDTRAGQRWPVDGTIQSFTFGGIGMRVSIADEAGKIDLNKTSADTLASLFESAGLSPNDATTLAGRVVDWRSSGSDANGDTAEDYSDAGLTSRPRKAPFQSVDELKLVIGMTPPLFAKIAPALTVYSHSANVDTAVASRAVLLMLPGMDTRKVDDIIAQRQASTATASQAGLGAPPPQAGATSPQAGHAFTIRSEVRAGNTDFVRQAVVEITGNPAHPYFFYDWR